jgi:hypothetical protein
MVSRRDVAGGVGREIIVMLIQGYGAAVLVVVAAVVLGRAVCAATPSDQHAWSSPIVGLAALMIVSYAGTQLPGKAVTALCFDGAALVISLWVLWRQQALRPRATDLAIIVLPLLAASVPFISVGRVDIQGVSVLNDSANHLVWAEGLRSAHLAQLWPPPTGYPLGPHAIVAAVGTLTGMPLSLGFTGLLIAIPVLTALTAQGFLDGESLWRRLVIALMCSMGYLVAAYYGQGAFKETIMAGLLVGFVLGLESVTRSWTASNARQRARQVIPLIVLVIGAVYAYSYLGLAWFGATLVVLLVLGLLRDRRRLLSGLGLLPVTRAGVYWAAGLIVVAAILVVPIASQTISFFNLFGATPGGVGAIPAPLANLIHALSPFESLGVWVSSDFRRDPTGALHVELAGFALALVILGFVLAIRRGQLALPSALVACALVWLLARHSGSPYVAAKALVIATPVVIAVALRPLLARREDRRLMLPALVCAGILCVFGLESSYQDLRNMPVQAPVPGEDLHRLAARIGTDRVLFLGDDDYSPWDLRPAAVTSLSPNTASLVDAATRPSKPWTTGDPLDFDSVLPRDLDRFRWVVTSNSAYASQAPPNFKLIAHKGFYELWRRTGPTVPRSVIESSAAPGAILACKTRTNRKISHEKGMASVLSVPVGIPGQSLLPGAAATLALPLPKGRWRISVQYFSDFSVHFQVGNLKTTLPAYLGRIGPFFTLPGTVQGTGSPVAITISSHRPSRVTSLAGNLFTSVPNIVATRIHPHEHLVPLRRACGRYVDWYRLSR